MATTMGAAVQKKKKKSTSAPSSPPKVEEQPHRRINRTVPDSHHGSDIISKKVIEQTAAPRYLKPTISSCHDTNCHYPKHQQSSSPTKPDAAAGKRLASRKPTSAVDKAHSPTSSGQKPLASAVSSRERAARSIASVAPSTSAGKAAAPSTRPSFDKAHAAAAASKTPADARTLPMRKTKSLPKLNPKVKEAAKSKRAASATKVELVEVSPSAVDVSDDNQSKDTSKHDANTAGTEQVEAYGGKAAAGERLKSKQEPEETNVAEAVAPKAEAKSSTFKKQEGSSGRKESTPAYNDAMEEAPANKLATRRSKVRALAGAFENGISLQKPEGHSSQQQEEAAGEKSGTGGRGGKDERQEHQQLKNGGLGSQQHEATPSSRNSTNSRGGGEMGQQSQRGTEKSKGDHMKPKEGNDVANDTTESTEEPTTERPK